MTQASAAQPIPNMAAIAQLIASAPAKALAQSRHSVNEDEMAVSAREYIELAQKLGAPPLYWSVPGYNGYSPSAGVANRLLPGPRRGKPLQALLDAGASPWLIGIHPGNVSLLWSSGHELALYATGQRRGNLSTRSAALKSAVASAVAASQAGAPVEDLFASLASNYFAIASRSSKTSKGVLGPADKEAKDCAGVLLGSEEGLLKLAGELEPLDQKAARLALIEPALKDARERHAAKVDKASAVVNPEKLKKQLTDEHRARLFSLMSLCSNHAKDTQLIELAFESTEWLSRSPMAASVRFGRDGSLFEKALSGGALVAIEGLEKVGANVWLAAAQSGQANACLWVAQFLVSRWDEATNLAPFARLLLRGAWLDGAQDPKGRCLELAGEAGVELKKNPYNTRLVEALTRLSSELERQTLEELLVPVGDELDEEPAKAEPKRRSSL